MAETGWRLRVLGVVVLVLTVASAGQAYWQATANAHQSRDTRELANDTQRLAQCLKTYANGTADAIDARTKAVEASTTALDQLFVGFLQATPDEAGRQRVRVLFTDYVTARKKARETQAEHPYPPAPRNVC